MNLTSIKNKIHDEINIFFSKMKKKKPFSIRLLRQEKENKMKYAWFLTIQYYTEIKKNERKK